MADFGGGDLDAFRAEARSWIEANFPPALKGGASRPGRRLMAAVVCPRLRAELSSKSWAARAPITPSAAWA
jgi:hypothetical protein